MAEEASIPKVQINGAPNPLERRPNPLERRPPGKPGNRRGTPPLVQVERKMSSEQLFPYLKYRSHGNETSADKQFGGIKGSD